MRRLRKQRYATHQRPYLWAVVVLLVAAVPVGAGEDGAAGTLRSIVGFFSWRAPLPEGLDAALAAYEDGRYVSAVAAAGEVLDSGDAAPYHDDAHLLRGLSFAALGWPDLAVRSFDAVLEADVSPYYPLALLGLVEAHHEEGGIAAVGEAYLRRFATPWTGDDRRSRRVRNWLVAYGDVRESGAKLTAAERDLLLRPSELSERLALSRERPTERLLYLAGLDLFRAGRHEEALDALARIAMTSPYFAYALYTSAQALFALGRAETAIDTVRRLLAYPSPAREPAALADRAALLHAQLLMESGLADGALQEAGKIGGEGDDALRARLLRAEICLETERPGLAVTYYRELGSAALDPRLEAGRGLGLGAAYAALGDLRAAADA
ncbi:MAG: tetratricopeptide repeat protein, partial [Candidatus Binatia bacterium]